MRPRTLLVVAVLCTAGTARASEEFPAAVQAALDMPCVPGCSICHLDDSGGPARRNEGLGSALFLQFGLVPGDPASVAPALEAAAGGAWDTDGDGTADTMELSAGTNPNVAGAATICGPEYGCFARVAPSRAKGDSVASVAALLAALSILGLSRRRRVG